MYPLMFPYGQIGWEYNFYNLNLPDINPKNLFKVVDPESDESEDQNILNSQEDREEDETPVDIESNAK
jgi:hypothetical protein